MSHEYIPEPTLFAQQIPFYGQFFLDIKELDKYIE